MKLTDAQIQAQVVRAFWDAVTTVREQGAEQLGLLLLVVGELPDGNTAAAHRGLYGSAERLVEALRLSADAIETGDIENAPELDQVQ